MTPFPTVDRADLEPGRKYTTQQFKPNITLTLPDGEWIAAGADSPDNVEIEPTPGDAVPGPDDYKDCGKVEGDCVVMFVGKVEPIVYGAKSLGALLRA